MQYKYQYVLKNPDQLIIVIPDGYYYFAACCLRKSFEHEKKTNFGNYLKLRENFGENEYKKISKKLGKIKNSSVKGILCWPPAVGTIINWGEERFDNKMENFRFDSQFQSGNEANGSIQIGGKSRAVNTTIATVFIPKEYCSESRDREILPTIYDALLKSLDETKKAKKLQRYIIKPF